MSCQHLCSSCLEFRPVRVTGSVTDGTPCWSCHWPLTSVAVLALSPGATRAMSGVCVCVCVCVRSGAHTSELHSHLYLVCRPLLENKSTHLHTLVPVSRMSHF